VRVEVAIPLDSGAETGDHEHLAGSAVLADDFEHRLVAATGPAADVGEAQEAAAE
jgi:hypothetical protein